MNGKNGGLNRFGHDVFVVKSASLAGAGVRPGALVRYSRYEATILDTHGGEGVHQFGEHYGFAGAVNVIYHDVGAVLE